MPRKNNRSVDQQPDEERQVSGGNEVVLDSLDNVRAFSPVSARSSGSHNQDMDAKIAEVNRLKILELECQLKLAKAEAELGTHGLASVAFRDKLPTAKNEEPIEDDPGVNSVQSLPTTSRQIMLDLPRVELITFDGHPGQYWRFIRQYENFVECKVTDPGQRFLYLLHYCRGRAREAIEGCSMLQPDDGYIRARKILRERFGQPFKVARNMIDEVLGEARRTRADADSLSRLAVKMHNCSIALTHMNYQSDLNALHTLESIVRCLPIEMQRKWAEEAEKIATLEREATFEELTDFVDRHSRIVNSRFGQIALESSKYIRGTFPPMHSGVSDSGKHRKWATANTISRDDSVKVKCKVCDDAHHLNECPSFRKMNIPDRWNMAKKTGACFICLYHSHRASQCRRKARCEHEGCEGNHHTLLHATQKLDATSQAKVVCTMGRYTSKPVRLGTIPVGVVTPQGVVKAMAFLDGGSDTTLVTEEFVRKHRLKGKSASLVISTVGGTSAKQSQKLELNLISLTNGKQVEVSEAFTVEYLPMKAAECVKSLAGRYPHLQGLPLEEVPKTEVDILIGCDVAEAHLVFDQRIGGRKEPYALHTIFGWVICGSLDNEPRRTTSVNCISFSNSCVEEELQRLYNNEFGDLTDETGSMSREDQMALSVVAKSRYRHEQFEVPLPWRPGADTLPNNREMVEKRLEGLKRRLWRNPQLKSRYFEVMQRNIDLGYVERLEKPTHHERIWYLPHHPVVNPKKPEKTRVVFDCAAKYRGHSLNDRLLQGPDWTTSLIEVLCRFRLGTIAVSADIQEMFLQVKVPTEHRDALRLLWWPDNNMDKTPMEYRLTVHPFGAVSSPFCANYALRETAKQHGTRVSRSVTSSIFENFYVDDYLGSFDDVSTATNHIAVLTRLLKVGGFRLTKWMSSSRKVLDEIPEDERAQSVRDFHNELLPMERTLGIQWNAEADNFIFLLKIPERTVTRRGILSSVSSLYDPLGFVAPWLLPGKLLLQRLCKKRMDWDQPLDRDDLKEWEQWLLSLSRLGEIRIPRPLPRMKTDREMELHLFSDASESGYGVVAYGLWNTPDGQQCKILFAKSRVAPLKTVTIPRLELTAAVLAVKVVKLLKRCFSFFNGEVVFWTDSAIVIHYIKNVRTRFSTFVANRLAIIHEETGVSQWRYVPSRQNPADYCSRGLRNFENLHTWTEGPGFLWGPKENWPDNTIPSTPTDAIETKRLVMAMNAHSTVPLLSKLDRFGDWRKILRAVSWWTRYKCQLMIMTAVRPYNHLNIGPLLPSELEQAERDLIRMLQLHAYPIEMQRLASKEPNARKTFLIHSAIRKLNPVLVDGLMRVGGRLGNSNLSFESKHPLIIPSNHHVTSVLILHVHAKEGHAGENHILSTIRRRFWIVKGRAAVKRVIRHCMFCRRQNAAVGKQLMSALPAVRVKPGWWPFAETGIDCFGPIMVRYQNTRKKRYGCIMTCLQSRAVHLEMVHFMTTDSFLMALQRFIGRRGVPTNIYSDNGSNFVGAKRELEHWFKRLNRDELRNRTSHHGINWHFNAPYASHRGGIWERLIRSVRRTLMALCGQQTPTDETLDTTLVEVERILNNRPLVPAPSDETDRPALTPNDLLMLRSNEGIVTPKAGSSIYCQGWKQANYLAGLFWRRWTREYLPTLQARQKWLLKERSFNIGDVVLLAGDTRHRNEWPIGVVKECCMEPDGLVRTVRVKTSNGDVIRDIRNVCLLEGDDGRKQTRSVS